MAGRFLSAANVGLPTPIPSPSVGPPITPQSSPLSNVGTKYWIRSTRCRPANSRTTEKRLMHVSRPVAAGKRFRRSALLIAADLPGYGSANAVDHHLRGRFVE
jgi:hypothetical protein